MPTTVNESTSVRKKPLAGIFAQTSRQIFAGSTVSLLDSATRSARGSSLWLLTAVEAAVPAAIFLAAGDTPADAEDFRADPSFPSRKAFRFWITSFKVT